MSEKSTTKPFRQEAKDHTNWELLRNMTDEEAAVRAAQDPDAPPTEEEFWKTAHVVWPNVPVKAHG
jgi:hypothetical protein